MPHRMTPHDPEPPSEAELEIQLQKLVSAARERGLRLTHQRLEIFREVAASTEHPKAEEVFARVRERLPTISLDTVYRALATLEELGLLIRIGLPRGGARYDADERPHHHFLCLACGAIQDIFYDAEAPFTLPGDITAHGNVRSIHVEIRGLCPKCS